MWEVAESLQAFVRFRVGSFHAAEIPPAGMGKRLLAAGLFGQMPLIPCGVCEVPPDPGDPMSEQRLTPGLMVIHGNHPEALRDLLCSG